jgi:[acyl-carrier-protein] S-malonyltransferase
MNYALLFPGQGSQHADMLPWLEAEALAAPVLQAMADILGADWRQRLCDEAYLSRNQVAQVLLTGVALAAWAVLEPLLPGPPAIVAGYSVGELAAMACAGAFDAHAALQLAVQRAQAMDAAVTGRDTGLLSVSGLHQAALEALVGQSATEPALILAPDHTILGGERSLLRALEPVLARHGAHCTLLPIRVASHTRWMQPAADAFAPLLSHIPWHPPRCPVACNASGNALRRPDALRAALSAQTSHTVQWSACLETIAERQVQRVLEVGPGRALGSMWARRYPQIPVRSLEDFRSAHSAAAWLRQA